MPGVSFKAYIYHKSCQHVRYKSHSALYSACLALSPGKEGANSLHSPVFWLTLNLWQLFVCLHVTAHKTRLSTLNDWITYLVTLKLGMFLNVPCGHEAFAWWGVCPKMTNMTIVYRICKYIYHMYYLFFLWNEHFNSFINIVHCGPHYVSNSFFFRFRLTIYFGMMHSTKYFVNCVNYDYAYNLTNMHKNTQVNVP